MTRSIPPALSLIPGGRTRSSDEMLAYRPYTRALIRRYFRMAVDVGRLPSILGGLSFRPRVSSYRLHSFEDAVIFVHDIERVFDRVERHYMEILAGVLLLDYSLPEVALRMSITVQRAERRYAAALDALSAQLLASGLLRPLFPASGEEEETSPAPRRGGLPAKLPPAPAQPRLLPPRRHSGA